MLPYYTVGALVVPVTEEFGWTRAQFQAAILFSSGLGVVTSPIVGWLCDRYGARRVALPSILGLTLGFFVAASQDGALWMLYLAYAVMAVLGAGTIPVTWTRAITTNFFKQRGLALGLALTGTGICGVFVPQYTTWLVDNVGWRGAYVGIALLPLLIALPLVWFGFRPREHYQHDDHPEAEIAPTTGLTLSEAARSYRFWVLLLSIFVVYMALSGIGANLYPAVTDAGMSNSDAATVMSVFGGAIILGRLLVGYLVDKFWAPAVASISMLLPTIGCWIMLDPQNFWAAAAAAAFLGLAAGAELDLMSFLAAKYFGLKHYAKIYAVLYMALATCSGTAPLLFAVVYDLAGSYAVGFTIALVLFLAGAAMVLFLGRYPSEEPSGSAGANTSRTLPGS